MEMWLGPLFMLLLFWLSVKFAAHRAKLRLGWWQGAGFAGIWGIVSFLLGATLMGWGWLPLSAAVTTSSAFQGLVLLLCLPVMLGAGTWYLKGRLLSSSRAVAGWRRGLAVSAASLLYFCGLVAVALFLASRILN